MEKTSLGVGILLAQCFLQASMFLLLLTTPFKQVHAQGISASQVPLLDQAINYHL
jgi:hypothetical protein